jgi:hypothetical protein
MKYLTEFFDDKNHFWTRGTITCILILFLIFISDVITTMIIINKGGEEFNSYMIPFVEIPYIFAIIKLLALNLIIAFIKIMYDIIQDKFYTRYNIVCVYFALIVPAIMTLAVVIHNLVILL